MAPIMEPSSQEAIDEWVDICDKHIAGLRVYNEKIGDLVRDVRARTSKVSGKRSELEMHLLAMIASTQLYVKDLKTCRNLDYEKLWEEVERIEERPPKLENMSFQTSEEVIDNMSPLKDISKQPEHDEIHKVQSQRNIAGTTEQERQPKIPRSGAPFKTVVRSKRPSEEPLEMNAPASKRRKAKATELVLPAPVLEYEDISAEVDERLKARAERRRLEKGARKAEKRKRESHDSLTSAADSTNGAREGKHEKKKLKAVSGNAHKAAMEAVDMTKGPQDSIKNVRDDRHAEKRAREPRIGDPRSVQKSKRHKRHKE